MEQGRKMERNRTVLTRSETPRIRQIPLVRCSSDSQGSSYPYIFPAFFIGSGFHKSALPLAFLSCSFDLLEEDRNHLYLWTRQRAFVCEGGKNDFLCDTFIFYMINNKCTSKYIGILPPSPLRKKRVKLVPSQRCALYASRASFAEVGATARSVWGMLKDWWDLALAQVTTTGMEIWDFSQHLMAQH